MNFMDWFSPQRGMGKCYFISLTIVLIYMDYIVCVLIYFTIGIDLNVASVMFYLSVILLGLCETRKAT